MSFVKMQRTQSLTRPTTHAAISTFSTSQPSQHNSISSQYLQPFTSLAAPKANPIFHAANKNLIPKIPFDYRHLTSSSSFYFSQPSEGTHKISEETTQRRHTYVTTIFLANKQQKSPAKIPVQNGRLNVCS